MTINLPVLPSPQNLVKFMYLQFDLTLHNHSLIIFSETMRNIHRHLTPDYRLSLLLSFLFLISMGISAQSLNIDSPNALVGSLNGPTGMHLALIENGAYRGYIGSYSGSVADIDFGTGGTNSTGKIHLTLQGLPAVTLDPNGDLGIGTTSPIERLSIQNGNILLSNSNLGIIMNPADRPLITRGFDAFTSGIYNSIGRWGLFMEPSRLTLGIPNINGKAIEFAAYNSNSSRNTLMSINQNGELNRPAQGGKDLLPIVRGNVRYDGAIQGGSGNFTVVKPDTGRYKITLTGIPYNQDQFITIATIAFRFNTPSFLVTESDSSSNLHISIYDTGGNFVDQDFNFVVYRNN
jgi:hypothetical protein